MSTRVTFKLKHRTITLRLRMISFRHNQFAIVVITLSGNYECVHTLYIQYDKQLIIEENKCKKITKLKTEFR